MAPDGVIVPIPHLMEFPSEIQALVDVLKQISKCTQSRSPHASIRCAKVTLRDIGFSHDVKMDVDMSFIEELTIERWSGEEA